MKVLVVGLGNPGKEYANTRHNVGFEVLDTLAHELGLNFTQHKKTESEIAQTPKIILAKPQTFMNNSGRAVKRLVDYFGIAYEDVVVVYDDVDLPLGEFREREAGSSAGHNGMQSILDALGTQAIARLRLGIGRDDRTDTSDYVLSKFKPLETKVIKTAIAEAVQLLKAKIA
ncbi:MAG: aminoacyl-tRNA hydrolase [Patescibacteria group bacterium]|nr:aminoacyl-tRNA hydrolase [Patescibacteria group bacterium]